MRDRERDPREPGLDRPAVLLVDDRSENPPVLEAVQEPLGARLLRAASAEQALRHVDHEDHFAVIPLDVQMERGEWRVKCASNRPPRAGATAGWEEWNT
jgi:CheY-like chemotaxis protein